MSSFALFQPRYPHGKSQTYLPGGIMNLSSRLMAAGVTVLFTDLNHESLTEPVVQERLRECQFIGFSVLGPPYIPVVIDRIRELRSLGFTQPILVGGEGIARLEVEDFQAWFGNLPGAVHQIQNDEQLKSYLGIPLAKLPRMQETSTVPALRQLGNERLSRYLTSEFCLYLSQGCAFTCKFCAAQKGRKEEYRTVASVRDEMQFICSYLAQIGHRRLSLYLSNLDIFQTSAKLEEMMEVIAQEAQAQGVEVEVRGLATSRCTHQAITRDPGLLARLRLLGLRMVAFGADGASEVAWRREGKRHNSLSELDCVVTSVQEAGMVAELLMVIGFPEDTPKIMGQNFLFSLKQARRGAVIRPYLAKSKTPIGRWVGKDEEVKVDDAQVAAFRKNADLLYRLDYAAVGSKETHPRFWQRLLSNATYLALIAILAPFDRCPTSPLAVVPQAGLGRRLALLVNRLMPFDR